MTEPDLNALREAARRALSRKPDNSRGERTRSSSALPESPRQQPRPFIALTPASQHPNKAMPQGDHGIAGYLLLFGLLGFLVIGVIVAVSSSHTGSLSSGPSPPVVMSPVPPAPPASPCTQADHYNQALREGVQGLKRFITECRSVGGRFLAQAQGSINVYLYQEAQECIYHTCNPDQCLQNYSTYIPQGGNLSDLQQRARAAIARCEQRANPPVAPPGQHVCHVPGGNSYWMCPIGQNCYGDHQCAGFGPIGRPAIIGR